MDPIFALNERNYILHENCMILRTALLNMQTQVEDAEKRLGRLMSDEERLDDSRLFLQKTASNSQSEVIRFYLNVSESLAELE